MRPDELLLPDDLVPADGRFGCGPSKVRQPAVDRLAEAAPGLLGTSHRKPAVKDLVRRVREGAAAHFGLPGDWEVALGVGGATLFWEVAAHSLIERRCGHAVLGEFSEKFAKVTDLAAHLDEPVRIPAEPGARPELGPIDGVDAVAYPQCETSTGVAMPLVHPDERALTLVDATSGAAGMPFSADACDVYYFSPQKCLGSEGGLWIALLSPEALARAEALADAGRRPTPMLDLRTAVDNSRKDQTYSTPAVATLFLAADQLEWLAERGGLDAAVADCEAKSGHVYRWAEAHPLAEPFVADPAARSPVVCTVDLDERLPADDVCAALRANGVLDTEAYRKLGRNQLRIATFPAVDAVDVERLTGAIDWIAERLAA